MTSNQRGSAVIAALCTVNIKNPIISWFNTCPGNGTGPVTAAWGFVLCPCHRPLGLETRDPQWTFWCLPERAEIQTYQLAFCLFQIKKTPACISEAEF